MKAIELSGLEGFKSLRVADVEKPKPAANQILIEVMAAGINFAELELTWGRYPALKPLPYVLGFEAAGIVAEIGSHVKNVKVGDKVTAIVSSGGYAEYATADAHVAIPIPSGISFAEASTIPVQGVSAYALLKFAAKPQSARDHPCPSCGGWRRTIPCATGEDHRRKASHCSGQCQGKARFGEKFRRRCSHQLQR